MRKITLNYYQDPGHGWVKIPIKTLVRLKIAHKISNYSYMRDKYAYLEEDCDLSLLLKALDSNGILWRLREYNSNKQSKIRSYESYMRKAASTADFMAFLKENNQLELITIGG